MMKEHNERNKVEEIPDPQGEPVKVYEDAMKMKAELDAMTDHKFLKKQNEAVKRALDRNDFKTHELLTKQGKINDKAFVYEFLEEEQSDGKSLDGN